MKKSLKQVTALLLAAGMIAGNMAVGVPMEVSAQQAKGTAPFINSWLVSGPYDTAVADEIYGTEEGLPPIQERPLDGNWAGIAQVSATSTWQTGATDFPGNDPEPKNAVDKAIDGDKDTCWLSQMHDTLGDPSGWPKWDPKPIYTLEWGQPIKVKEVHFYNRYDKSWGDGDISRLDRVDVVLKDVSGNILASKTVEGRDAIDYTGKKPGIATFDTVVENVSRVDLEIIHNGEKTSHNVGLGFSEVEVFDGDPIEEEDGVLNVNIAPKANVEASSALPANPVENLVDGSIKKQWVSLDNGEDKEPWVMLTWDEPVTFNEISLAQWGDGRHVNEYYDLTFTYADGNVSEPERVKSTGSSPAEPTIWQFEGFKEDVKSVKVEIDKGLDPYPSITGISEMEVYKRPWEADGNLPPEEPDPETQITPVQGENLTEENPDQVWEYFDDRVYNRNYDDYQDLNGYYSMKKGIDTKNKFVYAHTYIYSPKRQKAQIRMGASGSYRVYFNDRLLTNSSEPAEVQKDMSVLDVVLKEGWNKVLFQIEHTYTEDVNENGVPVAKDQNVSYLGFYGRVTDKNGNELDGVFTSTTGGEAKDLQIVTQGLSSKDTTDEGMGLPENTMPYGYKEWPYVWNKSTTNKKHGVSASAFQFQAAGGEPGYKWEVVEGKLPDNLTLNEDGTIADGLNEEGMPDLSSDKGIIPATCKAGDYKFTVRVTDKAGKSAEKDFTITVKERPNKWFEEGRVGALSHCIAIPRNFIDPNFSADLWAERAKAQGHSLVSIEALQQNYYWPSKFADPKHERNIYMKKDENGQVVDGLKVFEEAVKRYGIRFGLYYATEGGGLQHWSTDVFVQNVSDLIERYDPAYLYFDGPQGMPNANYDVMYSNVRNYNDEIIINSNAWGEEFGDPDLGTHEASGIYANVGKNHFVKKVVFEPWKSVHTKNNYTPYYARRDDYRLVAQEMIMNAGRGYVDNNDQMPLMSRGTNWDSPEDVATRYPKAIQEFIDVREGVAAWFAPEGKPERHESTTGTKPYFLSGYGYEDDGNGNYEEFAFPNDQIGPQWGYATSRDNNIYLHIMKGPDSKDGFEAIENNTLEIGPISDKVVSVNWLNEDKDIKTFSQKGERLTIDLSEVTEDPVDTIIKITTDTKDRQYELAKLYLEGEQQAADKLKINVEGQLGYKVQADDEDVTAFPALKAKLTDITFTSADKKIAKVDKEGIVTPKADGTTTINVKASYEDKTREATIKVTVKDGSVYVGEELLSATLHVDDFETYGEISSRDTADVTIEGRAAIGGAIGLEAADITWHAGTVDLKGGDNYDPIKITESDILTVKDGKLVPNAVEETTRVAVWADVKLGNKTVTTNRVYLDLLPYENMAKEAEVTASVNEDMVANLTDGKKIEGTQFDGSKWTAPANEESSITFKFAEKQNIGSIDINFNSLNQKYYNTPVEFEIQVSEDGTDWTPVSTQTGPTGEAYFGFYDTYNVGQETQYLRLRFDGKTNNSAIDLLEVAINGVYKESEPPKVDKSLLQKTYDYALTLDTDGVTDSAKAFFEKALKNAEKVLDKKNATQEEINEAWDNLLEGIWGLGIVKGDTEYLECLIDKAESMVKDKHKFVQDKWKNLETALEEAKEVMKNSGDATPDIVGDAAEKLWKAIVEQRYKANKDNLKELIDEANGIDLSKYTKESVDALKKALKEANAVMLDESLSVDEQAKVDKTANDLKAAIDELKLASSDGSETLSDDQKGTSLNAGKDTPKTGDNMPIMSVAIVLIAAVVAISGVVGARKTGNKKDKR